MDAPIWYNKAQFGAPKNNFQYDLFGSYFPSVPGG